MTFTVVNPEKKDAAVRRLIKFMIERNRDNSQTNKKVDKALVE